jgi:hypothetical protein
LQNLEGIGIERDLVGIPQIDVPPEMLDPDAPAASSRAQLLQRDGPEHPQR